MNYVFVYGTLKSNNRNHHYLENAEFIGDGVLSGYKMWNLGSYPAIKEEVGFVMGEVYQVDEKTLSLIDKLEDEGNLYKKVLESVVLTNGKTIECYVYVYLLDIEGYPLNNEGITFNYRG